jgi:(p)ppGpp synthase/HD superfamily hydrolase
LEAHRSWQEKNNYNIAIEIKIWNKYWNLLNIMTTCSELWIIILQVSIKNNWDWSSTITLESELNNPSKIAFMINSLKKNDDSIQIIKKKIS